MTRGRVLPKFLPELIRGINRAEVQGEGSGMELHKEQAAVLGEKPRGQMEGRAPVWGRVLSFVQGGLGQVIFVIYFNYFIKI